MTMLFTPASTLTRIETLQCGDGGASMAFYRIGCTLSYGL